MNEEQLETSELESDLISVKLGEGIDLAVGIASTRKQLLNIMKSVSNDIDTDTIGENETDVAAFTFTATNKDDRHKGKVLVLCSIEDGLEELFWATSHESIHVASAVLGMEKGLDPNEAFLPKNKVEMEELAHKATEIFQHIARCQSVILENSSSKQEETCEQ